MTIDECLKNWDDESTLKWILARGVSPKKWKAYALHAGVVDGRRWTYEEIVQSGKLGKGKTRARASQIMNEVESALSNKFHFSPHDPHCRRAAYKFLSNIRPERATSVFRYSAAPAVCQMGTLRPQAGTVFVCGEKQWRYCGESAYGDNGFFSPSLVMDISWLFDEIDNVNESVEYESFYSYQKVFVACRRYAIVWLTSGRTPELPYEDRVHKSRFFLLLFNCDGDFYEFDHIENGVGGLTKVFIKPLECKVTSEL